VTYSTDTSLARVAGHPTWRAEQREGRGDELIIDRTERTFLANGQAWFKMPARTNGMGGILPEPAKATTNASVVATNQFVEVFSDNYEFRTNMAVFREDVHVTERAGEQIKGKMTCRLLTLTFSGTNELQRMVADEKVVIEQGDQGFSAGKAVYEGRTGLLELTDEPSWRSGLREGKGDLVQVDVKRNEMNVKGNAFMRVPAQEMGETGKAGSKEPKEEYVLSAKEARFNGKVRIDHPRMKWTCEKMTAFLPPAGEKNQRIVAEQGVVFDLSESESQPDRKVHGTGEKVVYTYSVTSGATNDVVEMTGNPVLQTAQGTFENKVIILDRAHNTLNAPGKYRIHGTAVANVADFTPSFKKSR
jgi:lipopolysaccharide export system protein LptA